MCGLLAVSRSGFYTWSKRTGGRRQIDQHLSVLLCKFFEESRHTYGSVRLCRDIRSLGWRVSRRRVARLMRKLGLKAKTVRRRKITTRSNEQHEKVENIVAQEFNREMIDEVWCSDITYIRTDEGWLDLTVVIDLCSRCIIVWAMSPRMTTEKTTLPALRYAWHNRHPQPGLIFHSDRGSQYTCNAFKEHLKDFQMVPSMSGRGNCYDNAVVESFFHTLKVELMTNRRFQTRKEAMLAIFDYIEIFYNWKRKHTTLGYLSPRDFEEIKKELKNVS